MYDDRNKFRNYRTLIFILGAILLFELFMLTRFVTLTTFITTTIGVIGFLCIYLIVLCLRLVRELQQNEKNR